MIQLTAEDRQLIINLLNGLPELATERARLQILELAGLNQLIPMLDLSGSSFVAISEIIGYLSKYGRLTYDHEALGLFLNTLKGFVGLEQQEFLDELLMRYDMMTPIVALPAVNQWRSNETPTDILEKIIGENTLRPVAFLQRGLEVARAVAYVGVQSSNERWSGTGFLITQDLLLTNNHVVPSQNLLPNTLFRFNYEENFLGEAQQASEYRADLNGIFYTNEALDYTLVQVKSEPGKDWRWLPLLPRNIGLKNRINIIQHPQGQPKQISLQNNFVEYVGDNVIQYVTSTLPGSSGSPVFNDAWEVVALHHAGGNIPEPTTQKRYFRNEGILVESILNDLPVDLRELICKAGII